MSGDHQYDNKYLDKTDPIWWRTAAAAAEEDANQEEDYQVNKMDH